jgi:hypothetical protein
MPSALKIALEDLLRDRKLAPEALDLRLRDRRLDPFSTGISALDKRLAGGFPRGQTSEIHGPLSSGRMAVALGVARATTRQGRCAAWLDTADGLDPVSAHDAGVDLSHLLWLRGNRNLTEALKALGVLLCSGLFELVVFDLIGMPLPAIRCLPAATWLRLQRMIEGSPAALLLLAENHCFRSSGGKTIALRPSHALWSAQGPGRFLSGVACRASCGAFFAEDARFELRAGL